MSEKPIATYTERLLEVRREFVLYEDRVAVHARWRFKGNFKHVVKLETLKSEIKEITIRYRLDRYAGWVLAVGGLVFAMLFYNAKGEPLGIMGNIAMGVAIFGLAAKGLTHRNRLIRFARFNTKSDVPGLDIGGAGNKAAVFKEFAEKVRRQIKKL